MPRGYVLFLFWWVLLAGAHVALAQAPLPLIRATSTHVSIRDGGYLDKSAWTLSPKPDVYMAK